MHEIDPSVQNTGIFRQWGWGGIIAVISLIESHRDAWRREVAWPEVPKPMHCVCQARELCVPSPSGLGKVKSPTLDESLSGSFVFRGPKKVYSFLKEVSGL